VVQAAVVNPYLALGVMGVAALAGIPVALRLPSQAGSSAPT